MVVHSQYTKYQLGLYLSQCHESPSHPSHRIHVLWVDVRESTWVLLVFHLVISHVSAPLTDSPTAVHTYRPTCPEAWHVI